MRKETETFVI